MTRKDKGYIPKSKREEVPPEEEVKRNTKLGRAAKECKEIIEKKKKQKIIETRGTYYDTGGKD